MSAPRILALLLLPGAAMAAEPHFAPLEFLLGHCWRAPFPNEQADVQCFAPMYGGRLVHNTHVVLGSEPRYEGTTIYSWDPAQQRLRFHYFTSTGAVSEGHLVVRGQGYVVPERHVGSNGAVTELESDFARAGEHEFTVITRQKRDGAWVEVGSRRYRRTDAPGAQTVSAARSGASGEWRLVWNTQRRGEWDVVRQELDGGERLLTPAGSNEWVWDTHRSALLLLSSARGDGEARGWRAQRSAADGSGAQRLADEVVSDGFVACHPSGSHCLAEVMRDGRKRLLRLRDGRSDGVLDSGTGEDADPQFSPDGRALLFRSSRGGSWELWLADADGGSARALTADPANDAVPAHAYGGEGPARFSPDGEHIVWMRSFADAAPDIWRMRSDGSAAVNLTAGSAAAEGYPAWSPDGREIAFDSDRDGNSEIYLMRSDGSDVRRLSWSPGADLAPLWVRLPDATWQ